MALKDNKCGGFSISCSNCSLNQLCIPFSLDENELRTLDEVIQRKKPFHKGDTLFEANQPLKSLFAVRSGSFKSFLVDDNGVEQITAFHLPGDIIGFDALAGKMHKTYSTALETAMICEIPFTTVEELSDKMPNLRTQINRLMSNEISQDQAMFMLLNKKTAEQRIAQFLFGLSERFGERNLSKSSFRLSMTRSEIGNYLGLTVETVSRIFSKFQKNELIKVDGKFIDIINLDSLRSAI